MFSMQTTYITYHIYSKYCDRQAWASTVKAVSKATLCIKRQQATFLDPVKGIIVEFYLYKASICLN